MLRYCFAVLVLICASQAALACVPRDFLAEPLQQAHAEAWQSALEQAYSGIAVSTDGSRVKVGNMVLNAGEVRDTSASERLKSASITEQFLYTYPLAFDLQARQTPYEDPGRLRNDAFFRALYFENENEARQTLVGVSYPPLSDTKFWMTSKWGVDCQMKAALHHLAASQTDYTPFFENIGGSFNWRKISGTNRLSAHSFGISFDLNTKLGAYWKWTGSKEGNVGEFRNQIPASLVEVFERFGFIWGGKWNHFDGMHFEYRPELILYSRMVSN